MCGCLQGRLAVTVANMMMDDSADGGPSAPTSRVGILAIATGIAGLGLLVVHPGGDAKTFADVVRGEAANQTRDALVHGGFVIVLALQLICYAVFSRGFGYRISALAAFVFFAIGTSFLCASLLLDGLVTPAIAARYVAKPDKIESARVLFVLLGTMVSLLIPIGLAFQSAALAAWGWALTASGSRVLGGVGLGLGALLLVGLGISVVTMNPVVLMGGITATALWAILVGAHLVRQQS
jgi:hypothetical protein